MQRDCESIQLTENITTLSSQKPAALNKIINSEFKILLPGEQEMLRLFNYNVSQLKTMCRHYGVILFGANKGELISRLFSFLERSKSARTIQRAIHNFLLRNYIQAKGPAHFKRSICVNDTDFFTMAKMKDIDYEQFISFIDKDLKVYGFDILSLHNLMTKGSAPHRNPYNRNELPKELLDSMDILHKLSKIYFKKINICSDETLVLDKNKLQELKCITLFQEINKLGNYADHMWFWTLNKNSLLKFIHELIDIWSYRANLDIAMKKLISPPRGEPFVGLSLNLLHTMDLSRLRQTGLSLIHSLVLTSIDDSSRALGANYVLCSLTLVNVSAANSLPWLYQSVTQY